MNISIVIPAHNEEAFIEKTLASLCTQTLAPKKIVVVNDHSIDNTETLVQGYMAKYNFVTLVTIDSSATHAPGSKVINAFYKGFETLSTDYDIICKFDADLIFPNDYLETIASHFAKDATIGMVGGFCYIEKNGQWVLENLTNKDHLRGALKAYRKKCFEDIGGLKRSMGWDTVDELLAKYHNWKVLTDESLHIKHLKPTGNSYNKKSKHKQGEAFYKMRYGFWITLIASVKLAVLKKKPLFILDYIVGYFKAKKAQQPFLLSKEEGKFVRNLRWQNMRKKISL